MLSFNPLDYNFYPKLIQDYLVGNTALKEFYTFESSIQGIVEATKKRQFDAEKRKVLVDELTRQYEGVDIVGAVSENIKLLHSENTFTITTGHQLGIFTGPLYTLYKVMTVISHCKKMKAKIPDKNFIPVFWLASEDHDLEEIQSIDLFGKKQSWQTIQKGAVGRMDCEGLPELLQHIRILFANDAKALEWISEMEIAYQSKTLSSATRKIVHRLFGDYGLVIIDADSPVLKEQFVEVMKQDICERKFEPIIQNQTEKLGQHYKTQVNPRPINFFYLNANNRERITDDATFDEIRKPENIVANPENYSPNVCMRPMYQECILPNVCYVGGPSEIAYWLQLKEAFIAANISFPVLLVRNSVVLFQPNKTAQIELLGLEPIDFLEEEKKITKKYIKLQLGEITFDTEINATSEAIESIKKQLKSIDLTLLPQADLIQKNMKEAILNLQKKIEKVRMQKYEQALSKISKLRAELFPNNIPQERVSNLLSVIAFFDKQALLQAFENNNEKGFLVC
ncbi:MAG: bacillithiol biosynthesis cysteine-adding enzyme BshC [Flavobacteriaceae bacterium]|nr:bacillithiol biosynthesis cysteine-adding enzyme BshC [Flavobacteriaceae bacterium]